MDLPAATALYRYHPAAWLRVTGADAPAFLQGQFTNDLRGAPGETAVYGLWLDQKGKVLADSFLQRGAAPDEFWVGSYFSLGAAIARRLEDYIIADEVTVEDATARWTGMSLLGEGTGAWLAATPRAGRFFRGRREREENWEWILPLAEAETATRELAGVREIGSAEANRRRILAGIPAVPADIGPGDLPNEGGLEGEAISYTKGCYLGQEVMARLKSKGRIRRRLHRVAGDGPAPAAPSALWQGGTKVGELRSAASGEAGRGFIGLALLSLASWRPDDPLATGEGHAPTIRAAPLLSI
jgi:tRNA-modifying protein YgfZ